MRRDRLGDTGRIFARYIALSTAIGAASCVAAPKQGSSPVSTAQGLVQITTIVNTLETIAAEDAPNNVNVQKAVADLKAAWTDYAAAVNSGATPDGAALQAAIGTVQVILAQYLH